MALFQTEHVCKYFKAGASSEVRALDGVSLSIARGSFTLLSGPSGSGKTTLLALLGALERPTSGRISFDGRDLSVSSDVELARTRRRFGFIFQNFSLISGLPVWENITYPLIPRGVDRRRRYQLAGELLTRLRMPDKLLGYPEELSGGEQQRVAIARALAGDPEVLLADEPTSNLDQVTAGELLAILQNIHREGKTVVLSSHDPAVAALATQVHELAGGKLREPKHS